MTAHDAALANAESRRTFTPAEPFIHVDVEQILLEHRRIGIQCVCEDNPNGGDWANGTSHEEHVTAHLAAAGLLRDDTELAHARNDVANLTARIAVMTGQSLATVRTIYGIRTQETP